jgi:hypothetical protein
VLRSPLTAIYPINITLSSYKSRFLHSSVAVSAHCFAVSWCAGRCCGPRSLPCSATCAHSSVAFVLTAQQCRGVQGGVAFVLTALRCCGVRGSVAVPLTALQCPGVQGGVAVPAHCLAVPWCAWQCCIRAHCSAMPRCAGERCGSRSLLCYAAVLLTSWQYHGVHGSVAVPARWLQFTITYSSVVVPTLSFAVPVCTHSSWPLNDLPVTRKFQGQSLTQSCHKGRQHNVSTQP